MILESLQPSFPSIVENVTVSFGRKAVLKCEVENLRNYKVGNKAVNRNLGMEKFRINHTKIRTSIYQS